LSGFVAAVALVLALALPAAAPPVRAEEASLPVPAPLLLNLLDVPTVTPEAAFREWFSPEPVPRRSSDWRILPDGTARYGSVGVTLKNPCPEGTHKPIALPGRGRR
jgi:hypothetical protein